jgi:DNA-binding beta-propeller fold protein YncE
MQACHAPANNAAFGTTRVNVTGTITETSLKRVTVNGVLAFVSGSSWEALNVPLSEGQNTITATAEDVAGNSASASVNVTGVAPLVDPVQLTGTPVGGFAPLTVTFRGTAAAAIGTVQQVLLDYTGDHVTLNSTTLSPPPHAYNAAGQFFPVLTVVTSLGRFSSPGGWNSIFEPLRVNVESPPVVLSTISINNPVDLKWVPGNYLYVLSAAGNSVTEYDVSATPPSVLRTKSLADAGFNPRGLDVDASGNLYVAMTSSHKVAKYNPVTGSFQLDSTFGTGGLIGSYGSGNGQFRNPWDVAVSPDGVEIAVTDAGNHRIQWFGAFDGHFLATLGQQGSGDAQFSTPKGLTYDELETVYVVDSANNRCILTSKSGFLGISGSPGSGLGQFQGAVNLSLGSRGIYIADTGNNRIEAFDRLASSESPPLNPRLALSNQLAPALSQPSAVSAVLDLLQEKLYIADTSNNRVVLVQFPGDTPEGAWTAMKQRLLAGDIAGALPYFAAAAAEDYRQLYMAFSASELTSMISQIPAISPVFIEGDTAQYYVQQPIDGVTITFPINFVKEKGTWKILEY